MPRQTVETLIGYAFAVRTVQAIVTDENGNALHDGHGNVKTEPQTHVILVDPTTGHQVVIPLTDEGKQNLIRQLAGGIVIANGSLHA